MSLNSRIFGFAIAPALGLALVAISATAFAVPMAGAATAPASVTVVVLKDSAGGPLRAIVTWTPVSGTAAYEIQRAFIRSAGAERAWSVVGLVPVAGPDGGLTVQDPYDVGSGGVCYGVRALNPELSEFSPEACSPIPPTSSAPEAPNSGNSPVAGTADGHSSYGGRHLLLAFIAALLGVAPVSILKEKIRGSFTS